MEDDDQSGPDTNYYLGAKSGNEREPTGGQKKNGLELIALTEKEEGDWTRDEPKMI